MLQFIILASLFSSTVSAITEYKLFADEDRILIDLVESGNFAITTPQLKQFNWASVNVNGDRMGIVTTNCQIVERGIDDWGEDERRLLDKVRSDLGNPGERGPLPLGRGHSYFKDSSFTKLEFYFKSGVRVQKIGESHYILSSDSLTAAGMKRVLVDGEMVTFIHSDNRIQMEPRSCLDAKKLQLIEIIDQQWPW